MAVAHYLEALDWQREFIRIHAVLGGKNPHLQSFLVGGMATPVDPDEQASLNMGTIARAARADRRRRRDFVPAVYIPDLLAVASFYKDWAGYGAGVGNYLVYGEYPEDDDRDTPTLFLPSGRHPQPRSGNDRGVRPVEDHRVRHPLLVRVRRAATSKGLHPFEGETKPNYTGPEPPFERLDTDAKYSWLKSPRYDGLPMEVGPLARMLVAYVAGHERVKELVDSVLGKLGVGPGGAVLDPRPRRGPRHRDPGAGREDGRLGATSWPTTWSRGDLRIADNSKWDPSTWPDEATGAGFHEAPRGALGHWVHIKDGAIANYQCIVPSTWNAGPRDAAGKRGPYEAALLGTPIADPEQPVEILRTVHSFDPCMACGVHVVDPQGAEIVRVRAR